MEAIADVSRRRLLAWVAGALGAAFSCQREAREGQMNSAEARSTDVILRAAFQLTPEELRVAYQLENHSRSVLAVYDGADTPAPDDTESWPDLTENVYLSFQEPATLHLKRIRPPLPEDEDITFVNIPVASRLEPGAVRKTRFALKLPLSEFNEYYPDYPGAQWEERTATEVQLWIGYFRATPETEFQPLPDAPHIFSLGGQFGEQEFVTARQALTVKVRVRTDPVFQRL